MRANSLSRSTLLVSVLLLGGALGSHGCAPLPSSRAPCKDEVCGDGIDNDCDGQIDEEDAVDRVVWFNDGDRDGYGNPLVYQEGCFRPIGYVDQGGDCDDTNPNVNPESEEICDGLDNNCDGSTDLDDAQGARPFYEDADEDGYGNPDSSVSACERPSHYVSDDTDCDDTRDDVYPMASEYCDGVDNDCDEQTDELGAVDAPTWYRDADEDGFGTTEDTLVQCDEPAGYVADDSDCNDGDASINKDADELCDGIDNDCDDETDEEDVIDALACYTDGDGDGLGYWGDKPYAACTCPKGMADNPNDCNDADASVGSSWWYLDADKDGYGDPKSPPEISCEPLAGHATNDDDCADDDATISPAATEQCGDSVDNNCDGNVDEGC